MRTRFWSKSTLVVGALLLVFGLTMGFVVGGVAHSTATAHAAGVNGGLDIFPDGSITACTPTLGCTEHPAGTCAAEGSSGAVACDFSLAPHDGGAIVQRGVSECFLIQPSGSYFTSFNSDIVYAPSGQVHVRCQP